jgi:uncharacterized protein (DUF1684 family)
VDELDLLDWKRRVFAVYAEVRANADPQDAWLRWRAARDELFRTHPQSPLPVEAGAGFRGLPFFDYDPELRVLAAVESAGGERVLVGGSGEELTPFRRFATARFELAGESQALALYWLEAYGGGVFLPVADATSGKETYGAGRYVLDTVKGADLGERGGRLVVDFNFAYNPSCAYDPRWACPLTPPENRLDVPIRGGEKSQTLVAKPDVASSDVSDT